MDLSFLDDPMYERMPAYTGESFAQASDRTGIPFALLVVRP